MFLGVGGYGDCFRDFLCMYQGIYSPGCGSPYLRIKPPTLEITINNMPYNLLLLLPIKIVSNGQAKLIPPFAIIIALKKEVRLTWLILRALPKAMGLSSLFSVEVAHGNKIIL